MIYRLVHEVEELFLAFSLQIVDFIQKQHTTVCQFQQPRGILVCTGEGSLDIAEEIGREQFRVVRILRAVHRHKAALRLHEVVVAGIFIGKARDHAFARAGFSRQNEGQTVGGIGHGRLALFHQRGQTAIVANQSVKVLPLVCLRRQPLVQVADRIPFNGRAIRLFQHAAVQEQDRLLPCTDDGAGLEQLLECLGDAAFGKTQLRGQFRHGKTAELSVLCIFLYCFFYHFLHVRSPEC